MSDEKNKRIVDFIGRLLAESRAARELSLMSTARILEMAILELRTVLHSISEDELRSFTEAISEQVAKNPTSRSPTTLPSESD